MIEWELTEPEQGEANDSNNMNTTQDQDTEEESHHHDLRKKSRTNREQGPTKKPKKKKEKDNNQGLRKTRQTKLVTQETDLQKIIDNIQDENKRNNDKLDAITQELSTTKAQLKKQEKRKQETQTGNRKTQDRKKRCTQRNRRTSEGTKRHQRRKQNRSSKQLRPSPTNSGIHKWTTRTHDNRKKHQTNRRLQHDHLTWIPGNGHSDTNTPNKNIHLRRRNRMGRNYGHTGQGQHTLDHGWHQQHQTRRNSSTMRHQTSQNDQHPRQEQYPIQHPPDPPSYRNIGRDTNFCNRETIKFNYKLAEKHDTISMEPLKTDRSMIAHDGIHLTNNACIILGPEIIEKCRNINKYPERQATKTETSVTVTVNNDPAEHQDPTPRTTQPTDTVSEIFNTDKIRAGRIIGKKRNQHTQYQEQHPSRNSKNRN